MTPLDYSSLLDDLEAEEAALDDLVTGLDEVEWITPTPAAGWDVRATIAHLAFAEALAATALTDPDRFAARLAGTTGERAAPEADVVAAWRRERQRVLDALRARDARDRVPWVAGPMAAASFATARLMETWAHGHDVFDALGMAATPTLRLRHVADLGVRTRAFSYTVRGRAVPSGDVRVELAAPDGSSWTWGTSTADVVRGTALDFCLVVTQRRAPAATALVVRGDLARDWIAIAQAFAGPPTLPRGTKVVVNDA